jgi:glycosyltransferase involved in cell wall biosynthesis
MKIAFLNPSTMAFNVATPETAPLGGIASCLCYLARALAARGHDVTLISLLPDGTPPVLMGVRHLPVQPVLGDPAGFFAKENYDAAIAVNYPDIAPYIRSGSPRTLNIAWPHVFANQPALALLPQVQHQLDLIVYVSETQRADFRLATRGVVIGNAVSPGFENMFSSPEDLLAAKQNRAVYASMPFRGLDELVEVMGRTKAQTELEVFSSMQAYQTSDARFAALFAAMGKNPRIHHHGGVGQAELARHFRTCAFLVYPSTFIETYCIVAQEALAAGLKVISNTFGALPETTMGFADLLPVSGNFTRQTHVAGITMLLDKNEADFLRAPQEWAQERFAQLEAVNRISNWAARAAQWEALLAPVIRP